jgi:hypothetical protein
LRAGGVADQMVTQMLRQGDAEIFKLYSQAELGIMREALIKLNRQANEQTPLSTQKGKLRQLVHIFGHNRLPVITPKGNEAPILKGLFGRAAGI